MLGEIPASNGAGDAPTVLVYNHFDVQPPAPLELWESDPFELDIRGEWAYGRGVADDKGQLWLVLKAAQRLVEAGALPVNLRIAFDGEEEIGGHTIADWIAQDERGADACVIFDGGMLRRDVPTIELATRGLVGVDVKVRTGERDLHSGMYGGAALNAIHVLLRCLDAVLAGPDGRLPEPLRAGIAPPTADELAAWSELPPGAEAISEAGAQPLDAKAGEEFYVRTWAEPSTDVNGIVGGKPGVRNTTLSVEASAEFSIRLAPGQDAETIGAAAERLLREAAPEGAELEIVVEGLEPGPRPRRRARRATRARRVRAGARDAAAAHARRRLDPAHAGADREGHRHDPQRLRAARVERALAERAFPRRVLRGRDRHGRRAVHGARPAELATARAGARARRGATRARTRASRR